MTNNFDYLLKFIIIGDSNVGKSCILLRFTEGRYKVQHEPTLGVEFGSKMLKLNDLDIKIQIWDTAGQESFKSITRSYYKGYSEIKQSSIAAIIVYDICKRNSFENVCKWLHEVRTHSTEKVEIVLVGNKSDLGNKREVTQEEGQRFAKKQGFDFYETSAESGDNIEQLFKNTALKILRRIDKGEINVETESNYGVRAGKRVRKSTSIHLVKKPQEEQRQHPPKEDCYC